ncbi:hypothetical protein FQR65_LT02682 [Abscondita terminalis]|nr:hypothetical protein FQR65_LT02682 [Abscondita terminalis]
MSTQVNINWSKSYSLDRHISPSVYRGFVDLQPTSKAFHNFTPPYIQSEKIKYYQNSNNVDSVPSNSFLHTLRLRRNLDESRKAFLNFCHTKDDENELPYANKESIEQKKTPTRKISFKCKKAPTYRRSTVSTSKISTLNPNTVAELTIKFNELSEKVSILEQPKLARLVRRVNSLKTTVHEEGITKKIVRKPSVKIKPVQEIDELNKVRQRNIKNLKISDSDVCANNTYVKPAEIIPTASAVHSEKAQQTMNVRATIEIFERRSSQSETECKTLPKTPEKVPKPKVPEKNPNIKAKDLVVKNGIKKLKARDMTCNVSEQVSSNDNETKTELEDEVQILNIPLVMPRRCDSMYETLTLKKVSPTPPPITESKSESVISSTCAKPNSSFLWRQKSQELQTSEDWRSTYDAVGTTEEKLIPPAIPPRPTSLNLSKTKPIIKKKMPLPSEVVEKIYEELDGNNKTDEDYDYSRSSQSKYEDIEQKSDDGYECFETVVENTRVIDNAEEIYEIVPYKKEGQVQAPCGPQAKPLPPRPISRSSYCTIQDGENMSNCYESIYNMKSEESISNNYESIYACNSTHNDHWESASNRDSMVSSDQQSNSLYSRSLSGWPNDDMYVGKATSDLSGSDKSDEWIDISDTEENPKNTSGFVIVREKTRNKKGAGWSQKIRDQWNKSHSLEEGNIQFIYKKIHSKFFWEIWENSLRIIAVFQNVINL